MVVLRCVLLQWFSSPRCSLILQASHLGMSAWQPKMRNVRNHPFLGVTIFSQTRDQRANTLRFGNTCAQGLTMSERCKPSGGQGIDNKDHEDPRSNGATFGSTRSAGEVEILCLCTTRCCLAEILRDLNGSKVSRHENPAGKAQTQKIHHP